MNKNTITGLGVVLLVIVLGGGYLLLHNRAPSKPTAVNHTTSAPASAKYEGKLACDLFTLDEAKSIIGSNARPLPISALGNRAVQDTSLTTCPYTTASGDAASQDPYQTATLQVYFAKNAAGQTENQKNFNEAQKQGSIAAVTNLGAQAFYNSTYGQLEILKGSYWLVVASSTSNPTGSTAPVYSQDNDTKIAQAVLAKL
jgi:hypothetical protein